LTRRRLLAVCAALFVAVNTSSSGQTPAAETSPAAAAARAYNLGQYDQIDGLLSPEPGERALVLRARAHIARGRYPEAEKLLAGAASSNPGGDAALELGLLQHYLGRADATRTLQTVITQSDAATPADLLRLGLAAGALGRFQEANGFFRDATRLAPNDAEINTAWGELFLEKYNRPEALTSFQAALKANAEYVPARVGLARTLLEENPPEARSAIEAALKINGSYVPAHLLLAEMAMDNRERAEAKDAIAKALAVNPNSLEARSLDAAVALLEARTADFESAVAGVLKLNPRYGDVYRVAGDHMARNYRFDEAVGLTKRALEIDNTNTRAFADIGGHLLRTGDEAAARVALETAFKADPYDIVVYNQLAMLDNVDKFETIRDGDLIIRLDPSEAAVMREHVVALARQSLDTLSKQYQFKPQGPILLEMFPKHDDFAVRTIGLPGFIGALGACFGRVVTLDSPRARGPGEFLWASTLWHEMAHVVSLQMSNNRVPRWLSEGMSDFEERRARPHWGHERTLDFVQALEAGKLSKLEGIGEAVSDPRTASIGYAHAAHVIEYLIATYGEPALGQMLRAYGKGLETDAAFKEAFNATLDDVQRGFDAWLDKKYADVRRALRSPEIPEKAGLDELKAIAAANEGSFVAQMALARGLFDSGDMAGAIQSLERAATLVPIATGQSNPNIMIAAVATKQGNTARAIQALEAAMRIESSDVESARRLAELLEPMGNAERTAAAYARVAEIDPFDAKAQAFVGRYALQQKDAPRALRALKSALAAGPADRAVAHADLGEAYLLAGQIGEAKREALAALEIAPSFERGQDLLLKIVSAQPASGAAQ
jgi:tetratricopeptide (TPR) repeat protein